MARHPLGAVRVDLRATRARHEAGASRGVGHDTRAILYTNELQTRHRFVRIQRREPATAWVLAELRPSVDGAANWISAGLLASLQTEDEANREEAMQDIELVVSTVDDPVEKTKCACSLGSVVSTGVHFVTRARPARAIVEGLERTIATALHREMSWPGKRSRIAWLNTGELIEFHDVEFETTGTGCCAQVGVCSLKTRVSLSFKGDKQVTAIGDTVSYQFSSVEELSRHVEVTLGGVHDYSTRLLTAILARLDASSVRRSSSVGAILSGLPGIGKTALTKVICDSLGVHVQYLNATDFFQTFVGHSEAQIVKTFEELAQREPSILVIDGLEAVATSRQRFMDSDSTLEVGVLGTFVSCLEKLKLSGAKVFVLGTTSRIDDIDAAVYSNSRMDLIVKMEPPSQSERLEILVRMMRGWRLDPLGSDQVAKLSEATGGFVGADLLSMCQKALQSCLNDPSNLDKRNPTVLSRHFDEALSTTYPSVLQSHHVSLRQQDATASQSANPFSGIYGVDEALRTIKVSLLEPLHDCRRFLQFGTVPPKGLLLTGPPGSGKTHLANVVAAELRRQGLASFISVRCTDLLTKVVGDTEKALRELFETARSAAPCVIYFDQIESIAPVRGFDTSTEQTFDRLLSMLLVEMDGFSTSRESLKHSMGSEAARSAFLKNHIVIFASTTTKNQLDPAILRPGRFDVHIELNLPDREAREKIFLDAAQGVPIDYSSDSDLSSAERLAFFVADNTSGFSAGDLSSLLREAAMASMRERFDVPTIGTKYIRDTLRERQVLRVSSQNH